MTFHITLDAEPPDGATVQLYFAPEHLGQTLFTFCGGQFSVVQCVRGQTYRRIFSQLPWGTTAPYAFEVLSASDRLTVLRKGLLTLTQDMTISERYPAS